MLLSTEVASLSCENASLTSSESKFTEVIWKLPLIYKPEFFFWYILMTYIKTQGRRQRKNKLTAHPL